MEKILLAIDSQNLDESAVDLACYLARLTGSKLTAIFLENLLTEDAVTIAGEAGGVAYAVSAILPESAEDAYRGAKRDAHIALFRQLAEEEGVEADIYLDKGVPVFDIVAESRFADILILDATCFSSAYEGPPTRFLKDILQDTGCPVIIAPERFEGIDNIVFCYDTGKSSLFAMKQFSYLFPELRVKKAQVLNLRGESLTEEEVSGVSEWLQVHFSEVEWLILDEEETTSALFNYLMKKKDDFVVMGAYGRGLLASFFAKDAKEGVSRTTGMPIFAAHY